MKKITKDKEGNIIVTEEYDETGNIIHYKTSTGFEIWREYDEEGREIHYKDSDGVENFYEYED